MARKRSSFPVQVLLFLLVTLLGVATGHMTKSTGALPWDLEIFRRESLPLAGITVLLIIGLMIWRHHTDKRFGSPENSFDDLGFTARLDSGSSS